MAININNQSIQKNIILDKNKAQKQNDATKNNEVSSTNSTKDSVKLTSQALNLAKTTSGTQVNTKRIEDLKAAILNGDYKINTERLAEKLSQFESDFSNSIHNNQ